MNLDNFYALLVKKPFNFLFFKIIIQKKYQIYSEEKYNQIDLSKVIRIIFAEFSLEKLENNNQKFLFIKFFIFPEANSLNMLKWVN